ncbi:uncharacterized protein LOC112603143 [Melanaphis sacchari]|uniref:uncharacterized protein LOC112603143 n=1 Tax=Melanaphis sacchari TaxID=742174 RepID=UPI000DC14270|nr:uncharacterized protein LOC112603143 [Melanaphis sacchari]
METVREGALKRTLDEADDGDGVKKLKTDTDQSLPMVENIKNIDDPKKWNLLPSIVYDLLALLKKTEKFNSDEDKQVPDELDNDFIEDSKVLSNQNCQEELLNNSFKHNNLKEADRCDKISIEESNLKVQNITKVSIQNLNKLDFSSKCVTENVPEKVPLITKASPVQLFAENTDVHKFEQIKHESNRKTNVINKQLTTECDVYDLSMSTKNIHCTDPSTNDISKAIISTESVSNAATSANCIYNTLPLTSEIGISNTFLHTSTKSISNTPILTSKINIPNSSSLISTNSISNSTTVSSTNNNTIIVSENSAHQVISKTKNIFREQMFELLRINCFESISKIPLAKPSPCYCKHCINVTSLPIKQSTVYNFLFESSNDLNDNNSYHDVGSSNVPDVDHFISGTNDCYFNQSNKPNKYQKTLINVDPPKNSWVSELTSLIIKNDSKKYETNKINATKKSNPIKSVINKVQKATQHIKSHLSFCNKCKRSKLTKSDICKCTASKSKPYKFKK